MDENMNKDVNPQEESTSYNAQPTGGYYSNYTPPVNNYYQPPQPPKKKKKKGALVVLVIVVLILAFSALVVGYRILNYPFSNNTPSGDDTELELITPPASEDKTTVDGPLSAKEIYKKVNDSSVGVIVYSGNVAQVQSEGTGIVMGYNSDKTGTYIGGILSKKLIIDHGL